MNKVYIKFLYYVHSVIEDGLKILPKRWQGYGISRINFFTLNGR